MSQAEIYEYVGNAIGAFALGYVVGLFVTACKKAFDQL